MTKKLEEMTREELVEAAQAASGDFAVVCLQQDMWMKHLQSIRDCPWMGAEQQKMFDVVSELHDDVRTRVAPQKWEALQQVVRELAKR